MLLFYFLLPLDYKNVAPQGWILYTNKTDHVRNHKSQSRAKPIGPRDLVNVTFPALGFGHISCLNRAMYWRISFDRYLSNQKSRSRQPARLRAHSKKQLKAVILFCRYLATFPTKIAGAVFREVACIFALIAHAKVKLSENLMQSFSDTASIIAEKPFCPYSTVNVQWNRKGKENKRRK